MGSSDKESKNRDDQLEDKAILEGNNGMDIRMPQEIGSSKTLIIVIIVNDYTFDHMFSKGRFHNGERKQLFVKSLFNQAGQQD
uniref:Uncharacterized protein n=1 Tax=Romanomermis culicivorax TaxID=13658 RepID=A0A915IC24_ROMCU